MTPRLEALRVRMEITKRFVAGSLSAEYGIRRVDAPTRWTDDQAPAGAVGVASCASRPAFWGRSMGCSPVRRNLAAATAMIALHDSHDGHDHQACRACGHGIQR